MRCESFQLYCRKEFKALCKKYLEFELSADIAFKLLSDHFSGEGDPLGSKRLVYLESVVASGQKADLYKFHISVPSLRPGQWPRLWLGYCPERGVIVPLTMGVHKDNYSDNQMQATAMVNLEDYLTNFG